ncbi:MAG: nucleoside phosphorylase [Acetobacteraceae bacterium]|nr:nucleoside phosphorylase [Acetobacteraceae bacterium]
MTVVVATGMRAEAALLPPGLRVVVSGGDPARLRRKLDEAAEGATAVLSFGIAGGLDTALEPGTLVVATRVRSPGGAWPADTAWSSALVRASGARLGVVAGASAVVSGPDAKRSLRLMTDALVVDMESAVAAAFAAARGLPFAVLRAVADTAEEALPRAAAVGLTRTGRPAPGRVAIALLRRPGELPALVQVAKRSRTALEALAKAARDLPRPEEASALAANDPA